MKATMKVRRVLAALVTAGCLCLEGALLQLPQGGWADAKVRREASGAITVTDVRGGRLLTLTPEGGRKSLAAVTVTPSAEGLRIAASAAFAQGDVAKIVMVGPNITDAKTLAAQRLRLTVDAVGSPRARLVMYLEGAAGTPPRHSYVSRPAIAVRENGRCATLTATMAEGLTALHPRLDLSAPGTGDFVLRTVAVDRADAVKAAAPTAPVPPKPLLHAAFDETPGGVRGGCVDFTKASAKTFPFATNLTLRSGTIACWLRRPARDGFGKVLSLDGQRVDRSASGAVTFSFDRTMIRFSQENDRTRTVLATGPDDDGWHHYAITWDRRDVRIYVDGERQKNQMGDGYSPIKEVCQDDLYDYTPLPFERIVVGGERRPDGKPKGRLLAQMDELRTFSAPLDAAAIRALIRADNPGWTPPKTEPVDYAKLFGTEPNRWEGAVETVPGDGDWKAHGTLFAEVKLDSLEKFNEGNFRTTAPITVKELNGVKYFEAGPKEHDRFAINVPIPKSDLCYLELDYPDDAVRTIDIIVRVAGERWQGSPVNVGITTGMKYANTGKILTHRCLQWNPHATNAIVYVMTSRPNENAALAAVRVYALKDGKLPQLAVSEAPAVDGAHRTFGIYYEDPAIVWSMPSDWWQTGAMDSLTARFAAQMKFLGQNILMYPGAWYHGLIGKDYMPRTPARDHRLAWYERFDREGLSFVPMMGVHNLDIPEGMLTAEAVRSGALHKTFFNILDTGLPNTGWHGTPPNFNLLHPETRRQFLAMFDALLEEGKGHPSFKGIGLHLTDHSIGWWGTLASGYNDYCIDAFTRMTGVEVPVDRTDPLRGKLYAKYLKEHAYDQWVAWRQRVVTAFYAKLGARLRAARPDLKLYVHSFTTSGLSANNGCPGWRDPDLVLRRNREGGLDPAALAKAVPNLVLNQSVVPADHRWFTWTREPFPELARRQEEFVSVASTYALLKGATFPSVGQHDRYFETAVGHNTRGTPAGLTCSWSDELGWRVTTMNPPGIYARRHFVEPMRFMDILSMVKGGYLLGFYGAENALAPFVQAYRALPAKVMADVPGVGDEIVKMRETTVNGRYYAYVVNTGDKPRTVRSARFKGMQNLVTGETLTGDTLTIEPYMLVALGGAVKPTPVEVRVTPTADDATGEMLAAIEAVRRAGGGKIVLEKGDYHFRAETATQMKFFISNHHQSDSHPVHVPLANLTDVTVEGNGAKFVCHGLTMAMAVLDSTNVTVKGVSVDWARPFLTAARVVGITDTTTDIAVNMTREPCAVKDDRLVICGEGWQLPYECMMAYRDETKAVVPGTTDPWWRGRATALDDKGTFRLACDPKSLGLRPDEAPRDAKSLGLRLGDWIIVRPNGRPAPATIVYRSRGTVYEDVVLHSAFGMGVICQRSDGFTWRGTRPAATRTSGVFAPAGTDRFVTLHADATHFSNVKGEVRIEDCLFEGMMDDAINVHSTCLGITEKLDARRIRCRYKHSQAYGFGVFEKGESLRLIRGKTLENGPTLPIESVEDVDPWEVVLTLGADLPAGYGVGDAVENADYQPSVVFSRNIVGRNRARGALFTTPKSVRVTDNLFDHVSGSAILFAGDAQGWYESGACEDVVVSGNRFYDCLMSPFSFCKGVLSFYPMVRDVASQKKAYHRNIVVTNNVFDVHDVPLVFAISTENLDFRDNTIYQNNRYPGWKQGRFVFSHCSNMRVEDGNRYHTTAAGTRPSVCPRNGCYIFMAITGRPTDAELVARVDLLAQGGVDGFVIYARDGLRYEYMGEEWLHLIETLCAEAEKRNLKVWLYDEFAYPSGRCHGRVGRENEAFRYSEYYFTRTKDGAFDWYLKRGPEGAVNVYEPAAVERFIEMTHRVYARRLTRYLANGTILGIFTDEPGYPVWMPCSPEPLARIRYWSSLEADYRAETGRDFRADVEAFYRAGGTGDTRVWETYAALQGRQFRRAYFDPIARETEQMGIFSTGHLLDEEMPRRAVHLNGDPLKALAGLTLPGIDEVFSVANERDRCFHSKAPLELTTYAMIQHEALRLRRGAMAELFALGPAEMSPAHMRQLVWLGATHGVTHFLCSLDTLDMSGLYTRRIYLAPFATYQPWWEKYMPILADEMRTASAFALRTDYERPVAVRYPQRLAAASTRSKTVKEPDLMGVFHQFQLTQISTALVAEDEKTSAPFVFSINADTTLREEVSGQTFKDAAAAASWVRARISPALHLETADGTWADRLILRNYADGTSVVLNLAADPRPRALVAVTKAGRRNIELAPRGVLKLRSDWKPSDETKPPRVVGQVAGDYALTLDRPVTRRIAFTTNGVARIVCAAGLGPVRFAILDRPDAAATVTLDGQPLTPVRAAEGLPRNYRVHYRETASVELSEGVHELRLVPGAADDNFLLPRVVLVGDFVDRDGTIAARVPRVPAQDLAVLGLDGFAGEAVYMIETDIPAVDGAGDLELLLDTGDAFTEVKIGGRSLGRRVWAPYTWTVPHELAGTRQRLEIVVTASVSAFWGDIDAPDSAWKVKPPQSWWGIPPRDKSRRIGLRAAPVWRVVASSAR